VGSLTFLGLFAISVQALIYFLSIPGGPARMRPRQTGNCCDAMRAKRTRPEAGVPLRSGHPIDWTTRMKRCD
jgi:hypothetical protein